MKRYLLNSAVITGPGRYDYRFLTPMEARHWFDGGPVVNAIGYASTAEALGLLLDCHLTHKRIAVELMPGDEALVFRLVTPPGHARPSSPGDHVREFELGLLRREL